MAVRIGYACKTIGVPNTAQKSCIEKYACDELLIKITEYNLDVLENILDYNIKNNIKLFRISSGLIPFGSSDINNTPWQNIFKKRLLKIGDKIKSNGMRVSMHPGQYTVLNSPTDFVYKKAVDDLFYHSSVLDSLNVDNTNKIILHIGGIYEDKKLASYRFSEHYKRLDDCIKQRLVIENDDKNYSIGDVLKLGEELNIPVVFDNLHNKINPFCEKKPEKEWINECSKTWAKNDGPQKIHYSQQNLLKKPGAHSNTIEISEFMEFYKTIKNNPIDIMLEVKDKNLSAVKCINCVSNYRTDVKLNDEWKKYKYSILEKSPKNYIELNKLFQTNAEIEPVYFYKSLESALVKESSLESCINTARFVWRILESDVTKQEESSFNKRLEKYKKGNISINTVKNYLWKMSVKYNKNEIFNSYYFIF